MTSTREPLVHAIGTNHRVPVLEVDDGNWHRTLDVNLTSALRLGRATAGRLGTVEDLTGAVLFPASRQAAFITGQVLYVDEGRTLV